MNLQDIVNTNQTVQVTPGTTDMFDPVLQIRIAGVDAEGYYVSLTASLDPHEVRRLVTAANMWLFGIEAE